MSMNPLYAGTLGISAAIASALVDPNSAEAKGKEAAASEPSDQPAAEPERDLLAPELVEAAALLKASNPALDCDAKCTAVVLTEETLPGVGASQVVDLLLHPEERGLSIRKDDGTPAVTFTVMPTKLASGKGLVAIGRF
jgi:hypothetical protein